MKIISLSFLLLCFSSVSQASIKVAVTIDDLPTAAALPSGVTWPEVANKMLSALKKHKVPEGYAFINAGKVTPQNGAFEVLKLWKDAGYLFGNHTFQHNDLNNLSFKEFQNAIVANEAMLKNLMVTKDWKYFRYPYLHEGNTLEKRTAVRNYLKSNGYKIAQVTIDFEDWSWNNPYARCMNKGDLKSVNWLKQTFLKNSEDILERSVQLTRALFNRDIPHILLLHIGGMDGEVLDSLLTSYEKKGVEFIPLSQAMTDEIYTIDPGIVWDHGSEFPYQILKSRNLTLKDVGMLPYQGYPENELLSICQ